MINVKIKKVITSLFLIITLINLSLLPCLATTDTELIESDNLVVVNDEKKQLCTATLDDNFLDDRVVVMMKNSESLKLKNYSKEDFCEIDVKDIINHTEEKISTIKFKMAQYENLFTKDESNEIFDSYCKTKSIKQTLSTYTDEKYSSKEKAELLIKEEYKRFHQLLELRLNNPGKQAVLDAVKNLEKQDDILIAEPAYIADICSIPNDTLYNYQWSVNSMSLPSAWDLTTGSLNVKVGVIDSGINASHSDLNDNINRTLSKSFINDDPFIDKHGHGTKVSGVIGAIGNNNNGISGVCWSVSLVSLQVFSNTYNPISYDIVDAIDYAQEKSIDIINLSISLNDSNILSNAINNYDGLVICSAGNAKDSSGNITNGKDLDNSNIQAYPSKYNHNNIISVAAIDQNSNLVYYSNYGNVSVDLAAPGLAIRTTCNGNTINTYYCETEGTSLATPHVVGVAALIKSKYPTISSKAIKSAILDGTDKVSSLSGKLKSGGKVNAYKALIAVGNHTYNIKYNSNGGTGANMSDTIVTYGINTKLRKNTYSPPKGKKFDGWFAHRASDNKWYYTNGANSGWYTEGTQPTGYQKYLYTDEVSVAHTTSVKDDIVTLYAQWSYINYTVTFNSNGGTGQTMPSQQITYGTYQKLRKNTYTRQGYVFYGWNGYRKSDNKWYYDNGTSDCWCLEGSEPSGYQKHIYLDEVTVGKTTTVHNDTIIMYSLWIRKGDVNLDGTLSIDDVTLIQMYIASIGDFSNIQMLVADVNDDGVINIADITALQHLL